MPGEDLADQTLDLGCATDVGGNRTHLAPCAADLGFRLGQIGPVDVGNDEMGPFPRQARGNGLPDTLRASHN